MINNFESMKTNPDNAQDSVDRLIPIGITSKACSPPHDAEVTEMTMPCLSFQQWPFGMINHVPWTDSPEAPVTIRSSTADRLYAHSAYGKHEGISS